MFLFKRRDLENGLVSIPVCSVIIGRAITLQRSVAGSRLRENRDLEENLSSEEKYILDLCGKVVFRVQKEGKVDSRA